MMARKLGQGSSLACLRWVGIEQVGKDLEVCYDQGMLEGYVQDKTA